MLVNSILVLATFGNLFLNSFAYQDSQGIDKELKLPGKPLQTEQPILRIANQSTPRSNNLVPAQLNVPFQLRVNQTATISSENLQIKFVNVTGDSRCPADVACIWAGEVTIEVNVRKNGRNIGNFSLSSLLNSQINVDRYSLRFTNVSSGRLLVNRPIDISNYVVTLVVSRI